MAALKWSFVAIMALLSLAICSAHRAPAAFTFPKDEIAAEPDPGKVVDTGDWEGHTLGGGGGGGVIGTQWSAGGGGGGGWSSGGMPGYGGDGGDSSGGYGYGSGDGSGGSGYGYGGGSGGSDDGARPLPTEPFHCQPIACGNPYGCPAFTMHIATHHSAENGPNHVVPPRSD